MRNPPPFLISILLAITLVFTPVCTYASVDDNVSNSKLEILVGAPLDTEEPKTVFDWFRSIWSELLTITTTVATLEDNMSSLDEKVVALSSKIDSQTSTLNQKIDAQTSSVFSKIDSQTTTLSNKIGSSGGGGSSSAALPTGNVGDTVTIAGYSFYIISKGSDSVRLLCKTSVGFGKYSAAASAASSTTSSPYMALFSKYTVSNSGLPSRYEFEVLSQDVLASLVSNLGVQYVWTSTSTYDAAYPTHKILYYTGQISWEYDDCDNGWQTTSQGGGALPAYTIYRK